MAGDFWSQLTQLRSWNPLDYLRQGQQSKYTLMTENERQQARNLLQTIASGIVPPAAQAEYQQMKADPQQYLQTTVRQPPTQEAQAGMIQNLAGAMPLAFHGSPHKFEKFDISKVGTGQGAQSYGHGLYFAENPEVAKSYQETLGSNVKIRGMKISDVIATEGMPIKSIDRQALGAIELTNAQNTLDYVDDLIRLKKASPELRDVTQAWLRDVESTRGGAMYKVNIPDEHVAKMLDWDKPLSGDMLSKVNQARLQGKFSVNSTGEDIYKWFVQNSDNSPEEASKWLNELGIPGIKYLDQGSRSIGQGTRNFVVFDPSVLEGPLP